MAHRTHESSLAGSPERPTVPVPDVVLDRIGDRATVAVRGRLTPEKAAETSWIVRGLVEAGIRELVVDLTDCWDGAGLLAGLARARSELVGRGGVLRLSGVAVPELLAALIAAPLDEVFLVYDAVRHEPRHRRSVRRRTDWSPLAPNEERPHEFGR